MWQIKARALLRLTLWKRRGAEVDVGRQCGDARGDLRIVHALARASRCQCSTRGGQFYAHRSLAFHQRALQTMQLRKLFGSEGECGFYFRV